MSDARLQLATDADFAWLLGAEAGPSALTCAADLAPPAVLALVRGFPLSWMIIEADEVVGLVSIIKPPAAGAAEIGYGIAPSRRGRGMATRAVAALLPELAARGLTAATAGTAIDNPGSQRVLERTGFAQCGTRDDPEDGPLILWRRALAP